MGKYAKTVRTMSVAMAAAAMLGVFATTSATGAGPVVLGSRAFAPNGEGWGSARPSQIFNGGDPSGFVSHIHWTSWGGSSAIGYGLNPIFKPQGGYYRQLARIELRAHGLGRCSTNGPHAYTQLLLREPSYPGGPIGSWTLWSGAHSICRFRF